MRIAVVAPPFLPVPPTDYGGTELILFELTRGLVEAGAEVTLFASGDSRPAPGVRLRALFPQATSFEAPIDRFLEGASIAQPDRTAHRGPKTDSWCELEHVHWAMSEIARGTFDLAHTHTPAALPFGRDLALPMVHTIHHARDEALTQFYARHASQRLRFVAISARQAELVPEIDCNIVHHGLRADTYPLGEDRGYALFLGRLSRCKGPHVAVEAARAAGFEIRVAGEFHAVESDADYERLLCARLSRPGVFVLGPVGGEHKLESLAGARALLFPITWEEPFGLAAVEAMLCGTPVIAFARGSAPEIIDEGVTGFFARDATEMARTLSHLDGFDRARCRARARARFSTETMVERYAEIYGELTGAEAVPVVRSRLNDGLTAGR